jgi:nucleoside 2-deoxyribosyltransferase
MIVRAPAWGMFTMQCLVIMPFRAEFDAVFACVREAAQAASQDPVIDCYWLKDRQGAGKITDDIIDGLGNSAFCIADLTGNNPNVMWETGYAMALGRPVILIGQSIGSIPFDLHNHRLLEYDAGQLDELQRRLTIGIH